MLNNKDRRGRFLQSLDKPIYFDEAWYTKKYLKNRRHIRSAWHYFKTRGIYDGHEPNQFFDSQWYLQNHADIKDANVFAFSHFLEYGEKEGRGPHPLFDLSWYAHTNPDVAGSGMSPFQHFLKHGLIENRSPHPMFDAHFYEKWYRKSNDKDWSSIIDYIEAGNINGNNPNAFFNNKWYNSNNDTKGLTALEHYILVGSLTGSSPHPAWSDDLYLDANPDLRRYIDQKQLQSPYRHFCEFGRFELLEEDSKRTRRFYFDLDNLYFDFDEQAYRTDHVDVDVAVKSGRWLSGLEHFFIEGFDEVTSGHRKLYDHSRFPALVARYDYSNSRKAKHACMFVHWDRHEIIDDYVISYIKNLKALDIDIFFITTVKNLVELKKLQTLVSTVVVKSDAGRDFVSWFVAYTTLGSQTFDKYEYLFLVNDSAYFPVNNPKNLFNAMEKLRYDFWSITDSYDWSYNQYHLQSYFMGFSHEARKSLLPRIMELVSKRPYLSKRGQVIEFELKSTKIAMDSNISIGAICPIDDIREDAIRDKRLAKWRPLLQHGLQGVNSTMGLWDLLISYYNCPTVKVELLRDNPHRITNVSRWPEIIGNKWLSTDVIENHLQRIRNSESTLIRPYPAASAIITEDKIELRQIVCGQGFGKRKRLVLFAHYDPHSIIDPHVIASINGFNLANCDVVFITSTHSQVEISKVINLCAAVIIKSPGGRDFGSWQIAIQSIKREFFAYDSIVWVNDSIYYPLFDPNEMFDVMEKRNLDFWGVTDSETIRHHIMSWFWSFNKKIINDGWFDWFENNNNTSYTKWAQIRNLETRIPGSFNRNGYKIGSFITASDIKQYFDRSLVKDPRFSGRTDFTMTHIFWDLIIKEFRCPALKVELLRDNPLGIDISKLQEFVEINTDYNASLIEGHLRRINRYDPIALVGH